MTSSCPSITHSQPTQRIPRPHCHQYSGSSGLAIAGTSWVETSGLASARELKRMWVYGRTTMHVSNGAGRGGIGGARRREEAGRMKLGARAMSDGKGHGETHGAELPTRARCGPQHSGCLGAAFHAEASQARWCAGRNASWARGRAGVVAAATSTQGPTDSADLSSVSVSLRPRRPAATLRCAANCNCQPPTAPTAPTANRQPAETLAPIRALHCPPADTHQLATMARRRSLARRR